MAQPHLVETIGGLLPRWIVRGQVELSNSATDSSIRWAVMHSAVQVVEFVRRSYSDGAGTREEGTCPVSPLFAHPRGQGKLRSTS